MMKTRFLAVALAAALAAPAMAQAVEGTGSFTLGAVQTDLELLGKGSINGLNLKYQFEPAGSRVGFLGSFTYAGGEDSIDQPMGPSADIDMSYYSLALGPSYRINRYVSAYGLFGFAGANAELESGTSTSDHFEPVFGAGVRVFPFANVVIDAYYEKATAFGSSAKRIEADTVSLGLGVSF